MTKISIRSLSRGDYKRLREIEQASVDEYVRYLKETGERDTVAPSMRPAYFEHYLRGVEALLQRPTARS